MRPFPPGMRRPGNRGKQNQGEKNQNGSAQRMKIPSAFFANSRAGETPRQ
jgi:hypothetical protein